MNKRLAITFGVGVVAIAIAILAILYMQRGAHIELKGAILKIRTAPMDANSSVGVIDFRFDNPANYPFVVRTVDVIVEDKQGNRYLGSPVPEVDAKRLFEFYPLLGQKYHDSLLSRDKIKPRTSEDRMIAARFELPEAKLESRKRFIVRIEDVDGPISEISEK